MTELAGALQDFHFLRPLWLLPLPVLALLIAGLRRRRRGAGAWQRVIHPRLQPLLVGGAGNDSPWAARGMLLAALLGCLALAGPTWDRDQVATSRLDSALVILFDLSPSMLATDIRPDRLTRARLKTIDILNRHREGSVALVAWAGDAHVVSPLTTDANTLLALLPVLHPDIMPLAGANPELALEKGLELLMNTGYRDGDILFVTDGFVEQAAENLQHSLRNFPEMRLSILGVGTDEGAPVPLGDGSFARDSRGGIVVARLGSTLLERLAQRNGGRYATLTADDRDIDHLMAPITDQALGARREQERTLETWRDRGPWLVLALLPLAVLAFKRNLLALFIVAPLALSPATGKAGEEPSPWRDWWHNRDRQGYQALQNHQPGLAAELFKDNRWRAVADYRRGDFSAAEAGFAQWDDAAGHFNRGNALARQGRLEEALAAYDSALAMDPQLQDADFNRDLVQQLLDSQAPPPTPGNGGPREDGDQPARDSEASEQTTAPNDAGNDEVRDGNGTMPQPDGQEHGMEGETSDALAGNDRDERETASSANGQPWAPIADDTGDHAGDPELEYWLRRIADDPGGLLRRKFQYQARQQALEPRQRFDLPPDRFQEERW